MSEIEAARSSYVRNYVRSRASGSRDRRGIRVLSRSYPAIDSSRPLTVARAHRAACPPSDRPLVAALPAVHLVVALAAIGVASVAPVASVIVARVLELELFVDRIPHSPASTHQCTCRCVLGRQSPCDRSTSSPIVLRSLKTSSHVLRPPAARCSCQLATVRARVRGHRIPHSPASTHQCTCRCVLGRQLPCGRSTSSPMVLRSRKSSSHLLRPPAPRCACQLATVLA